MRAGAYTIHQSLTAEAAAVLKLALALARRRGHAQVTPLHVAFALLSPACSSAPPLQAQQPYGLLKRACLRSRPAGMTPAAAAAHPLQCRALELCFNVALNRLPTSSATHSPPPAMMSSSSSSSAAPFASSLIQPNPTLSNALVAALKRAQANQRRGCVELQQPAPAPPPPPSSTATQQQQHNGSHNQQQQQPLLAIKVELDQLIISILDDPSVSRVMREAGFSSSTVKSNLEEESAALMHSSSSSPPPPSIPPHFFLDPTVGGFGNSGFMLWPPQFLSLPAEAVLPSCTEDVRAVLEVMVRKQQGRRTNPVVVGDTVSMAESVAGELLRRLESGDVPEELAGAHLLKLQLSYVHVRLMSRADVDAKAAELRRSVDAVQRGSLVVYVGDLRWALDEDHGSSSHYSPVEHMVAELGRLLGDLRRASAAPRGRVWLVATASYQTYMRCQQRRPSLELAWALQAIVVPTGSGTGLALNNLHSSSSSSPPSAMPLQISPFTMAGEQMQFSARDEQEEKLLLCTECSRNFEREASAVKAEPNAAGLPGWLVPEQPPADQTTPPKENYLIELKRKWSRLCMKLHLCGSHTDPCFGAGFHAAPSLPWWSSGSCLPPSGQSKPTIQGFLGMERLVVGHGNGRNHWSPPSMPLPPHWGASSVRERPEFEEVTTALALGSLPLSDSASSDGSDDGPARELERRLRKNVPWQPTAVAELVDAVAATAGGCRSDGRRKGAVWLFLKGSDHAAKRRAAAVIAETHCGSADQVIATDASKLGASAEEFSSDFVARASAAGGRKLVLVVDDVERAPRHVVECLMAASRSGVLKGPFGRELDLAESIVILTTSRLADAASSVISLRLWTAEEPSSPSDLKRKLDIKQSPPMAERKRSRHGALDLDLNLNLCADGDNDTAGNDGGDDEDEDAVPSDITHEGEFGEHGSHLHAHPHRLLESVASRVVTLNRSPDGDRRAAATIRGRLVGAVDREVRVDDEVAEALAAASGHFLDEVLERWVAEVFEPAAAAAATAKNGGKVVVLSVGPGGGAQESGFMGSVLPSRVHLD